MTDTREQRGVALGRLEPVNLRDAWTHEANEFTPWLAQPENLALLGESLGLELEFTAQEQAVGDFSADILCKASYTGEVVLIENQLGRTDHTHLGQIITYAAGLQAKVIVWVTAEFRDEHRAALDWLNDNLGERAQFFGVEVQLYRIGNSLPAPQFNVVSKPNDWSSSIAEVAQGLNSGAMSDTKIEQQRYWTLLKERLEASNSPMRCRKPLPQHWTSFSIGRSGCSIAATVNSLENRLGVEIYLGSEFAKSHFQQLLSLKNEIEAEIGEPLEWQELPGKKSSRIITYRKGSDLADVDSWAEQHAWMQEKLERFDRVFRIRVKALVDL